MRTFEAVFGPKTDRWLEYTVAGLLVTNGGTQVVAVRTGGDLRAVRLVGYGTAATLLAIDVVYVPRGRIRWTYLLDGAAQLGWIGLWMRAHPSRRRPYGRSGTRPRAVGDRGRQ